MSINNRLAQKKNMGSYEIFFGYLGRFVYLSHISNVFVTHLNYICLPGAGGHTQWAFGGQGGLEEGSAPACHPWQVGDGDGDGHPWQVGCLPVDCTGDGDGDIKVWK